MLQKSRAEAVSNTIQGKTFKGLRHFLLKIKPKQQIQCRAAHANNFIPQFCDHLGFESLPRVIETVYFSVGRGNIVCVGYWTSYEY